MLKITGSIRIFERYLWSGDKFYLRHMRNDLCASLVTGDGIPGCEFKI